MKQHYSFTLVLLLCLSFVSCIPDQGQPGSENIPLNSGWKEQGPGAINAEYQDGSLELEANLQGGDDYAELYLDLRNVRLSENEPNQDGTYNLTGSELAAIVKSDQDFEGDPDHPNGVQLLLKDENGNNLEGRWLDERGAMMSPTGMEVFFAIPDERIAREVAGISLKFTIGSGSSESFKGSFVLQNISINR